MIKNLKISLLKKIKTLDEFNKPYFPDELPLIGNYAKILPISLMSTDIETIDVFPKEFINLINSHQTIKDIITDENSFYPKYNIEVANKLLIKTKNDVYDSRLLSIKQNSLYNEVGNITGTHLDINDIDMRCLPKQLRNSSNLKSIQQFIIKQVIRNNSKSVAIIMTRYLVFILIDYLRYSQSKLLLDDTKESQIIIKSLAFSLPTITQFSTYYDYTINEKIINLYLIFHDEQTEDEMANEINTDKEDKCNKWIPFKSPGITYMFHYAFKAFLKKSENYIPTQFMLKLLKETYENCKNNSLSLNEIYNLIKKEYKMESISPLPDSLNIQMPQNKSDTYMFIPIIVSSIHEPLPSVIFTDKRLRTSSDKISYFYDSMNYKIYWKYDIKDLENKNFDRNYKLKFGLLDL